MNKKSEAYPSYAKAIKHLNLKFKSLAEAHNFEGEINVFENDNLLSESGMAGFSSEGGSGFSGKGNNEGQESLWEEEEEEEKEEIELTTEEAAIDKMLDEEEMTDKEKSFAALAEPKDKITYADKIAGAKKEGLSEHKLSILKAMNSMDAIIDSLTEGKVKKKVYTLK